MATTIISRTAYNLLIDDSGSGTDGSIWDKADIDDILDAIDAIFSGAAGLTIGGSLTLAAAAPLTTVAGSDLVLDVPTNRSLLIKVNNVMKTAMDLSGNWSGLSLAAGFALGAEAGNDLNLNVPSTRALLIKVNGVTKQTMDTNGNWLGLSLAAGTALTEESGNDLRLTVPSGRSLLVKVNGTTKLTMDNAGALTLLGIPGFAASDKYLIVDASGNVHKSALGPAS